MRANLPSIVAAFTNGDYNITGHGLVEMDEDEVSIEILERTICYDIPEIIEDSPDDPRGASCLILAWFDCIEPIHTFVGYAGGDKLEVITVYRPDRKPWLWEADFRTRRR